MAPTKKTAKKPAKVAAPKAEGKATPVKAKGAGRAKKERFCAAEGCKLNATMGGYCRLHYLKNYRTIKAQEQAKAEKRLSTFIDRLAKKYPNDYLERLKEGIESEEKFRQTVYELELEQPEEPRETEREYLERFASKLKLDED
jgi:hypothetical protein